MKRRKQEAKNRKPQSNVSSVRSTISFPFKLHEALEEIAKEKKVSLAWVVREASEKYIADKRPLFKGQR